MPASSAEIDILNELRDRLRRLEDAASKHQKHFNQSQAARHLGRSKEWLRILHLQKRGPKHSRIGRYYNYRLEELEAFANKGITESDG